MLWTAEKGGLVTIRHNEICDLFCELSLLAWKNVVKEPTLQEPSPTQSTEGLAADLAVRGVWQQQCTTMFDVWIIDNDASYSNKQPLNVLTTAVNEKKRNYSKAVRSDTLPLHRWPNGKRTEILPEIFSQSPLHYLGTRSQFNCKLDSCQALLCLPLCY